MYVEHVITAAQPYVDGTTLTPGRLWSAAGAVSGLAGMAVGVLAVVRSRRRIGNGGRRGAFVSVATGLIGVVVGAWVVAAAEGGPGTGYGIVGGYVSLAVGIVAAGLGALTLMRARRVL